MSDTGTRKDNPWPPVVQAILEEARRAAGSGSVFAADLEDQGVGGESGRYSESAISNWIKGRTMPPADVLLAAAKLAGISVDEKITGRPSSAGDERIAELESHVLELRTQLDRLQTDLIDLYGRTGQPLPVYDYKPSEERLRQMGVNRKLG